MMKTRRFLLKKLGETRRKYRLFSLRRGSPSRENFAERKKNSLRRGEQDKFSLSPPEPRQFLGEFTSLFMTTTTIIVISELKSWPTHEELLRNFYF